MKRKADGKPDIEYMKQLQEGLFRAGFIDKRLDVSKMVDLSRFSGPYIEVRIARNAHMIRALAKVHSYDEYPTSRCHSH
jgi:hypothetical protein